VSAGDSVRPAFATLALVQDDQRASAPGPAEKPPTIVELTWQTDLQYRAQAGDQTFVVDSDSKAGPSPMQLLACGLAGCMGIDLVHILTKARQPPRGVVAKLTGRRPLEPPTRFIAIDLHFTIDGDMPDAQVQRAIDLSREKYCSVWNSMRQDIQFTVTFTVRRTADTAS